MCRFEFCSEIASLTLNDTNLVEEVFTPGYPDPYNTDTQCGIVTTVDVSRSFTVTMLSEIDDCSNPPYTTSQETPATPLAMKHKCLTNTLRQTVFTYNGRRANVKTVKILLYLKKGSGNAFKISVSGKYVVK